MNTKKIALAVLLLAIVLSAYPVSAMGALSAEQILNKAQVAAGFKKVVIIKNENFAGNWNIWHIQADLYDSVNPLPIRVDILWNIMHTPQKNSYWQPGSGLSFEADFLAKPDPMIALVKKGSRVIGISPREAQATLDMDMAILKDLGMPNHTRDFSKIIDMVQSIYNLPYEVGGHSAGALDAEHYASLVGNSKPEFKALRKIDMPSQYPPGSTEQANAILTSQAINRLMNMGIYANFENVGSKQIADAARINPTGDSGFPRGDPLVGNFTNINLLNFSLIFTGSLPGMYTGLTGLPGSWYLKKGYLEGTYNFDPNDPSKDTSSLTHTSLSTVYKALDTIGSGVSPLAYERDVMDIWSGANPIINRNNIKVPVYSISTEGGFDTIDTASSMPNSPQVTSCIMPGYSHADPTFADKAVKKFWPKLYSKTC